MQTFEQKCPHASYCSKENVVVLFVQLKLVDLGSHYYPGSVACFNMWEVIAAAFNYNGFGQSVLRWHEWYRDYVYLSAMLKKKLSSVFAQ